MKREAVPYLINGCEELKYSAFERVDRSQWRIKAYSELPQIQQFRQQIYPLGRAMALSSVYRPGKEVAQKTIYQLILEYMERYTYNRSFNSLQEESGFLYEEPKIKRDETTLLRDYLIQSIIESEKLWDALTQDLNYTPLSSPSPLEEQLYQLQLIADEVLQEDSVSVWEEQIEINHDNVIYADDSEDTLPATSVGATPRPLSIDLQATSTVTTNKKTIKAASLNILLFRLTDSTSSSDFISAFLMMYSSFCTAPHLFRKLTDIYYGSESQPLSSQKNNTQSPQTRGRQLKIVNIVKKWLEFEWNEFAEEVRLIFKDWLIRLFIENKPHAEAISISIRKMEKNPLAYQKQSHQTSFIKTSAPFLSSPDPIVPKNIFNSDLNLLDICPEEIARQICLLDFEIYRKIKPKELINQAWSKPNLKYRAGNVLQLIRQFNLLSTFVSYAILKTAKLKKRIKVFQMFVEISYYLKKFNNFNSMMAILSGLNSSAIFRLKWTRSGIPKETKEMITEMDAIMAPDLSYKCYREKLKSSDPPTLPYLGTHLTDLTFIDENPDWLVAPKTHKKLINWTKRKLTYSVISTIQQYQQKPYNFQRVHQITELVKGLGEITEQELYRLSLLREPRDSDKSQLS